MLYDGAEFGHEGEVHVGSDEEMDFLGIPGLLEADQVRDLLRSRQSARAQKRGARSTAEVAEPVVHEQLDALRRELNGLVAAWHHRTNKPHGVIHSMLRRDCGGPAASAATAAELQQRIDLVREWAARRTG